MLSNGCEASGQWLDHSELEIGGGIVDPRFFEVLGEVPVAAEPGIGDDFQASAFFDEQAFEPICRSGRPAMRDGQAQMRDAGYIG